MTFNNSNLKSTFSQSNTSQRKRSASKNLIMFYIRNNGNLKDLNQINLLAKTTKVQELDGKDPLLVQSAVIYLDKYVFGYKEVTNVTTVKYEFLIENTGVKLHEQLPKLTAMEENFIQFKQLFLDQWTLTGWDEANALKILRSVIHSKFRENVSKEKSVDDVMNALLKIKYSEKYNMRIIQYLNNLKLTQFQTIDEYIINIQTVLEILKLNNSYTLKELDHKEKEIFLNGLNDEIITWFTGQGLESPSKMIARAKQIENQLIIAHQRQTNLLRSHN
ncbi:hypothetical protein M153_15200015735 [Pseudoloma neurophilia]|uniref:Transposable element n=1 Tax=Pseudoloma neurophilia TaxID=146866 RepID=A0A0R0M093_9MICR|nr:hypothetical protein M153_15200015735 [Pseudoloma neurophilia]